MISQDELIETLYQANGESRAQAVTRITDAANSLGLTAFSATYNPDGANDCIWTDEDADEICLAIFGVGSTFSYTDVVVTLLDEGYAKDDVDTAIDSFIEADSPVDGSRLFSHVDLTVLRTQLQTWEDTTADIISESEAVDALIEHVGALTTICIRNVYNGDGEEPTKKITLTRDVDGVTLDLWNEGVHAPTYDPYQRPTDYWCASEVDSSRDHRDFEGPWDEVLEDVMSWVAVL